MRVTSINFNDYNKNPMALWCHNEILKQGVEHRILELKDLGDYIEKCSHSKFFIEEKDGLSYCGDQLRLLLSLEDPDFFYMDEDAVLFDIKNTPKNSVAAEMCNGKVRYNNGTFFYGCQDYNKFYYDIYEKFNKTLITNGVYDVNYIVMQKFTPPKEIELPTPVFLKEGIDSRHYYISQFQRYKKCTEDCRVVYFTWNNTPRPNLLEKQYWSLDAQRNFARNGSLANRVFFWSIDKSKPDWKDQFYLWKQQMCYTLRNPCLIFKEL